MMKQFTKRFTTVLLSSLFALAAVAQSSTAVIFTDITDVGKPPLGTIAFNVCGAPDTITFSVVNNSGGQTITGITIDANLATGLQYVPGSVFSTNNPNGSVNTGHATQLNGNINTPKFTVTNIPAGQTYYIRFLAQSNCDAITAIQGTITNNFQIRFGVNGAGSFTNNDVAQQPYNNGMEITNIPLPSWVYGQNLNLSNGQLGCRQYYLKNTSITFGSIKDFILYDQHTSGLSIVSIGFSKTAGGPVTNVPITTVGDSAFAVVNSALLIAAGYGDSLGQQQEMYVTECVRYTGCVAGTYPSTIGIRWGTCSSYYCQDESNSGAVQITVGAPAISSGVDVTSQFNKCFGTQNQDNVFFMTNTGSAPASRLTVRPTLAAGELTTMIAGSMQVDTGTGYFALTSTGGVSTDTSAINCFGATTYSSLSANLPISFVLNPGQTIRVKFQTRNCCPTICGRAVFNGWSINGTYRSSCNLATPIPFSASGRPQTSVDLAAVYTGTTTFLPSTSYTIPYTVNGVDYANWDSVNGQWVVRVTLPAFFTFSDNVADFTWKYGNISWVPTSATISGGVVTARFNNSPPVGFVFKNSKINVLTTTIACLPATCSSFVPDYIYFNTSYVPDRTCASPCEIPVECFRNRIRYQRYCGAGTDCNLCPLTGFSFNRTSYGSPDNANIGLPNGASFIQDSIYTDRGMYLDTFQASYEIRQSSGATFNSLFANINIDNSNFLSYIGGTISIRDSSAHVTHTCQLGVPNKVGNIYSWKINASTVSACSPALGLGYTFDSLDVVVLNAKWRITTNVGANTEYFGDVTPGVVFSDSATVQSNEYVDCDFFDKYRVIGYTLAVSGSGASFTACEDSQTVRNAFNFRIFQGSAGENPFPYEYRDWTHFDTLTITVPRYYSYNPNSAVITLNRTGGDDVIVTQTASVPFAYKTVNGGGDTIYRFVVSSAFTGTSGAFPYSDDGFDGYIDIKVSALNCNTANVYRAFSSVLSFDKSPNQHLIKNVAPQIGNRTVNSNLYQYSPSISLSVATNPILGSGHIVQWQFQLINSSSVVSPNTWMTIASTDTNELKITSIVDITGAPTNLSTNAGGLYVFGDLPGNSTRTFLVNGYYSSCVQKSINVFAGWNCNPYGYPATQSAYAPCQAIGTTLYVNPVPAKIQTNVIEEPSGRVNLCDTVPYAVRLGSVDYGRTFGNFVDVFAPLTGIKIIPGSWELGYPGTANYITIPDQTIAGITPLGKRYVVNTSLYNAYLDSFGLADGFHPDSASVYVRFKVVTDCDYLSGSRVLIRGRSRDLCGNALRPSINSTKKLRVNTIGAPPQQVYDLRIAPDKIIPCDSSTTVTETIYNTGPYPSDSFSKLIVYLERGISYLPGSNVGLLPPVIDTLSGIVRLTFSVPAGLKVNDSVKVSYNVYAVDSGFNYQFIFRTQIVNDIRAICVTTGDTCNLSEITGEFTDTLTVGNPKLALSNLVAYSTCNNPFGEVVHIDYDITNFNISTRPDLNIYANLWWDANNNHVLDKNTDQKIGTYVINHPIDSGQTVHVTGTYAVQAFQACGLLIQIDSITSACLPVNLDTFVGTVQLRNAGSDVAGCFGDSVTLGCLGSINGYTYTWSGVGAAPIGALSCTNCANPKYSFPVNLTAAPVIYQYVVSTNRGNCTTNDTVSVTVNASPTVVNITSLDTNICFGQSTNLTATGSPAGGAYQWSPLVNMTPFAGNTAIVTVNPPLDQTYVVKYVNVGCASYANITVHVIPQVIASAGNDKTVCLPATPVTIGGSPSATGGSGNFQYTWAPATGLNSTTIANPTATVTGATTYTLTVTDLVSGCFATSTTTVNANPTPNADAGPNVSVCPNSSVQLGASGGVGYTWSPATGLSNPNFCCPVASPTVATWYHVTVTDIIGCKGFDSVLVSPVASFTVTVPDAQICDKDSVKLVPSVLGGQYTYNWTPGSGLSCITCAQPTATPNVNTIYVLTVRDTLTGCTSSDTVPVTVRSKPRSDFFGEQKCHGDTVQFTDRSQSTDPIASWSWDFGDSTYAGDGSTIQNPTYVYNSYSAHDASLTITTIYGCKDSFHLPVYSLPPVYPNAGKDTFVGNGSCVILGGTGGTIFTWSPDSSLSNPNTANPTACPVVTTTYTVSVTNDFGCKGTDTVTITVKPLPNVNAGPDTSICYGSSYVMQGSSTTPNVSYKWTPITFLSNPNIANPVATPTTTFTYVLRVTDQFGIVNYDTMTLTVNSVPVVDAGTDKTLFDCAQDSVKIGGTPTANGGSGSYSYAWSPTGGLTNSTDANPFVKGINASTQYCVTVTDLKGCTATDCVNVSVTPSNLSVSINQTNPTSWCEGSNGTAQFTANITGGTGPYTYAWAPNTNINSITSQVVTVNPNTTGTFTYTVTVTDAKGCFSTVSASVTVNPKPVDTFTVTGGGDYCLATGGLPVGLSGSQSGVKYQLLLNNANVGTPVNGTGAAISFGNQTAAGTYTVVATNNTTSCVSNMTGNVTVVINPLPIADAGADKTIVACSSDSIQIGGSPTAKAGTPGFTYAWSPNAGLVITNTSNPWVKNISAPITYTITVTDSKGCTATDDVLVNVTGNVTGVSISNNGSKTWCEGANGSVQFTANVTGGVGLYTYSWTPTSFVNPTNTQVVTINPSAPGTYVYTVVITDGNGCQASTKDSVIVNALPHPVITNLNTDYCASVVSVPLTASIPGGTFSGPGVVGNTFRPKQIGVGTYTIVYTVKVNGCTHDTFQIVTVNPLPVVSISGNDADYCSLDYPVTFVGTPAGGTWSGLGVNPTTGVFTPGSVAIPNNQSKTVKVTYHYTDTLGCTDSTFVNVTVKKSPALSIAVSADTICVGTTVKLTPTFSAIPQPVNLLWYDVNGTFITNSLNPIFVNPTRVDHAYYATIVNLQSCTVNDTITIHVNQRPTANDDTASSCEGFSVSVDVRGNDTDPEGNTNNVKVLSVQHGTASVVANNVVYKSVLGYFGLDTFVYQICNTQCPNECDTAQGVVNVCPQNEPPVASPIYTSTPKNTPVPVNVGSATSDPNSDPLTYGYPGVPVNGGTVTVTGNGTIIYTPATGFIGKDSFPYIVCDLSIYPINTLCDTSYVVVYVTDPADTLINHAPIANDDLTSTSPTNSVDVNVRANDKDPDGDALTIPLITGAPSKGTATVNADGTIKYTPNPALFPLGINYDTIKYKVCDTLAAHNPKPLCDDAIVIITVNNVDTTPRNRPPFAGDDYKSTPEDVPVVINVKGNDSDPDGDNLTLPSILNAPVNGTVVVNPNGTITYTPTSDYHGLDTFTYVICDTLAALNPQPLCDTATVYLTIDPRNEPPVASDVYTTTTIGTPIGVNVAASSSDPNGDPLTYSYPNGTSTSVPGSSWTGGANGTGVYTPAPGFIGTDSFQYVVCDNSPYVVHVLCDTAWVYVVVNDTAGFDTLNHKPIANDDHAVTTPTKAINIPVKANDNDPDGNPLTVSLPSTTTLYGTVSINPDGTVKYTPTSTFPLGITRDSFTYVVCDVTTIAPQPLCDTAVVYVDINRIDTPDVKKNDPPVATDDYRHTPEDSCIVINVKANDSDPNGDLITTCNTIVSQAKEGLATVNPDGTITYCPTADFHGNDTFTYCICDNGTPVLCDTAKVIITIDPRNEPPVASDVYTTTTIGTPIGVNVAASSSDPNGDPLTYSYPNGTSTSVPGSSWTGGANGTGVYTPAPGFIGTDSFQYVVCDNSPYVVHVLCDTAWVYVVVNDTAGFDTLNHKPIANDDHAVTTPTKAINIPVKANDNDPDGNPLTVSLPSTTTLYGTVSINPDGTVKYTPTSTFPLGITRDSFTYVVCDVTTIAPQPLCDTAVVYVDINRIDTPDVKKNDPPVATDDYRHTPEDSCIVINVKANDSDPNGDLITTCNTIVSQAKEGLATVNPDGTITYCPTADFHGNDTFTYCICDNGTPVLCDTAKVIITIDPRNEPPVASDVYTTTTIGTPIGVNVAASSSDPNGDPLTYSYPNGTSTSVPGSSWTGGANGTGVYTPAPGFIGTDSFQYVVCDNSPYVVHVLCDTAWVYVVVNDTAGFDTLNHKPIANDDHAVTTPTKAINIPVKANDNDPDGNPLTVSLPSTTTLYGTVSINPDGTVKYTPTSTFPLGITRDSFTYVVCDVTTIAPQPLCDTAVVYVDINRIDTPDVKKNDPPVATDDYRHTPEDSCIVINVKANDSDPNGDLITTCNTIVSQAKEGLATVNPDGTITYCPTADFHGNDTFTYCICDNGTPVLCDTAKVIITIDPRNEPPVASDVYTTTTIGTPIGVNVAASSSDPNGDPLTYSYPNGTSTSVPGSSWTGGANGTGVYTPAPGFIGTDSFQYVVCDNSPYVVHVLCDTAWVYVVVNDTAGFDTLNHKPIANDDHAVTTPTKAINIPVKANDNDPDGNPLTVSLPSTTTLYGTVSINPDGTVKYTPTSTFPLGITRDSFTYVVCDVTTIAPQPLCDTAVVYVDINRIDTPDVKKNDPPVATDDYRHTPEDSCIVINVKANDSDPNGDLITTCNTIVSQAKEGLATVNPDGTITYCPTADFHGNDTFTYCICDNGTPVLCDTAKVIITIDPRNEPPVASDVYTTTTIGTPIGVNVAASSSDPNGDPLTYSYPNGTSTSVPGSSWTGGANGTGVYTPAPGFIGTDSFQYVVCDNSPYVVHVLCDTAWVYVVVNDTAGFDTLNHKPIANDDHAVTTPTKAINIPVKANDNDPDGNPLTVSLPSTTTLYGTVSINPDGTVKYTPTSTFPLGITRDSFTYVVCDVTTIAPQPLCDTAVVYVDINRIDTPDVKKNDPPVATDDFVTICEEEYAVTPVLNNDGDPNGDLFTIKSIVSNPAHGLAAVSGRDIVYIPAVDYYGQDTLSYSICDNGTPVLCDTAKVIYTIRNVNDAPIAINDSAVTGASIPVNVPVLINDIEPDGDSVTVGISTPPIHGKIVQVGNTYTYVPDSGFVGYDTFYYKVCDVQNPSILYCGTFQSTCDVGRVSVHVIYNNLPPVITPTYVTLPEDTGLVTICPTISDPDGNNVKITAFVCGPNHGTASFVNTGSDSCLTYKSDSNYFGPDTICVVVCDDGLLPLCDTDKVYINVVPVCDAPIALDDYYTVTNTIPSTSNIVVIVNDRSVENSGLVVSIVTQPTTGTVSANANNTITYIPNGATGLDSFQYRVCNTGLSCTLCDTAWVHLNVRTTNNPPIAVNDTVTVPEDSSICVDVTVNDSDPDNDPITLGNVIPCGPSNGTAVVNNGQVCYTPNHNFNGKDSLCYIVCDNGIPALCDTALVIINVTPKADPPIAVNDTATTTEGTPVCVSVMNNDSDPDGRPITITAIPCAPATGTAVITGNTICYTPSANYTSKDSFCYVICDDRNPALCDTAEVYINITPNKNHPPVAVNDTTATPERTPVVICVPTNDLDPDFNLNLASVGVAIFPAHGTIDTINKTTGCITYTPDSGFTGVDTFVYTICDTGLPIYCDDATVYVTVTPVNHPPVALDTTVTTPEDSTITVCPTFSDPDKDSVSITAIPCGPLHGTVTFTGTCITYTPAHNYNGLDSLCYVVCDNGTPSLCDTAKIRIIVTPVVDCPVANTDYSQGINGTPVLIDVLNNDTYVNAVGQGSVVTILSGPAAGNTATANPNGSVSYTAAANYIGIDTVVYRLCDTVEGCCDTATIYIYTIDYCVPPIALNDKDTVCEEAILKSDVRANDFQGFGKIGNVSIIANGSHGFGFVNSADTTILYTPVANFFGKDTITYQVCSQCTVGNLPLCDTAQLFITVLNRNDVPVAIDDTTSVLEDGTVSVDVLSNDYDIDGDSLVVSISAQPAFGVLTLSGNKLVYTPNANYCGPDSFGYKIVGGAGDAKCPGDEAFDLGLVFVNVICVNDPPVIPDTLVRVPEDSIITLCVPYTDNDPKDIHTLSICGLPTHGTVGNTLVLDNTTRTVCLTYKPDTNFNGLDSLCVIVCDNGTPQLCDTSHIVIVVDPRNEPPVATNVYTGTTKGTPVPVNITPATYDPNGDPLIYTYPLDTPIHGTWTPTGNGTGVYTPTDPTCPSVGNNPCVDSFTYVVCDTSPDLIHVLCDTAKVYISIYDTTKTNDTVNHAPIANTDYGVTDTVHSIVVNVRGNDFDPDGDPLTKPVVSVGPKYGTVTVNGNGTITYQPGGNQPFPAGAMFEDSFQYVICDTLAAHNPKPLCDSAWAHIIINRLDSPTISPNHPPVATNDYANTTYGTSVNIPVLINDADPDGDSLTNPTILTGPHAGTVTVNPDGTVTYTPYTGSNQGPNANHPDTFTYVICDVTNALPNPLCDTATVVVRVPNSVQAVNDTTLTGVNVPIVINVKGNDYDPELDSFTVTTVVTQPAHGTAVLNPNGTITFTPDRTTCDYTDSFKYSVMDTLGAVDTATVYVFVKCCKVVAVDDNITMAQGDTLYAHVLNNDNYDGSFPQYVTILTNPLHGTVNVLGDTLVQFIPAKGYCGKDFIEYIVHDTCGQDTANMNVTIICDTIKTVAVTDYAYTPVNTPVVINILDNDTFSNCTPAVVAILDSTNHGTVTLNGNGSVTYSPDSNYIGLDTFQYRLCETCGTITSCDSAFGYIRIDSVCQGPIANADFDTTGYLCNDTISVLSNDVNLPIGSAVTIVKPAQYGQSYVLNNEVVYVPNGTQKNGADSIVYSVCNVCDKCDTGTLYIKLTGYGCNVHHPNLVNDTIRICRNTDTLIRVLANDKDVDGNGIHITSFLPGNNGMVTKVGDSLLYHPNNNFTGTDVFVYQACDDGDPTLCNTAEVHIIVDACRNDTPVVHTPIVDTTFINVPITVCLDSVTDANGDSVFISSVCKPTHGVITGFAGLCFTYQPDSSFIGNDTFCLTICDNGKPFAACSTIPVVITVLPKDSTILVDSVFANNDVSATNGGTPVTIPVLSNDGFTPNPGNAQTGTGIVVDGIVSNPKNGTVVVNPDGTITYTPNEEFCGIDTFQYSIKDNGFPVQKDTAYVYVYVCGTPVVKAVDDNGNCTDTTTTVGSATDINVLANDTLPFASDTTVTIYNAPDNGTASVNTDNTVHYIPRDGFIGNDNFEYIVCATIGEKVICDTASVCVNVADTPKVVPCYFPNGFSPNGDGANDVFAYPCNNQYPNATLKVFNRWGDEVWRSEGAYKNDWNGTNMQGTVLPDGTYYFIYTYNDGSGKSEAKFVVLHR